MAYSENVKKEAKRLYLSGYSCNEVAEKLNINPDTVFRWKARLDWDLDLADDSVDGLKKQIAAISVSDDPLTDAQTRRLDKLSRAVEKLERSSARQAGTQRAERRANRPRRLCRSRP